MNCSAIGRNQLMLTILMGQGVRVTLWVSPFLLNYFFELFFWFIFFISKFLFSWVYNLWSSSGFILHVWFSCSWGCDWEFNIRDHALAHYFQEDKYDQFLRGGEILDLTFIITFWDDKKHLFLLFMRVVMTGGLALTDRFPLRPGWHRRRGATPRGVFARLGCSIDILFNA